MTKTKCPVCHSVEIARFSKAFDRLQIERGKDYEVHQCRSCLFGWTVPEADESRLSELYPPTYLGDTERVVEEYLSGRLSGTSSWRMEVEKVQLVERFCGGGKILDVGCGEGKFLWALDGERWERHGVELNAAIVETVGPRVPGVSITIGSLDAGQLPLASFDVITFWHVLEHIPRPAAALQRVFELLKPGGTVVISLPNIASHQARWFRSNWYAFSDVPRHLHHFSPGSLRLLLEAAGLEFQKRLFFSKAVNFHCWKHSARSWVGSGNSNPLRYLALKPVLHALPLLERATGEYGVMTVIGRRPGQVA